jgi:hypothetical protein
LEILSFLWENGSHSEMRISGCDISRTEVQMGIHGLVQSFPELQNNIDSSSGHNLLGHSMQTDYPRPTQLYQLWVGVGHLNRYKVSFLGQLVHNYPKGIISWLSPRQSHDKIHSNLFTLPLGYSQWLQHPSGSLMLGLDFLTGVTKGNILDHISLHSMPPIGCLEIMVHLIPS